MKDKIKELIITLIGTGGIYYVAFEYVSGFYKFFGIPAMYVELELSYFIISLTSILTISGFLYLLYSLIKFLVPSKWGKKKVDNIIEFFIFIGIILIFGFLTEFTKTYIITNLSVLISIYSIKIYRYKQLKTSNKNASSKEDRTSDSNLNNKKSRFDLNDLVTIWLVLMFLVISTFSYNLGKKFASVQSEFTVIETNDSSIEKVVLGYFDDKMITKTYDKNEGKFNESFEIEEMGDKAVLQLKKIIDFNEIK